MDHYTFPKEQGPEYFVGPWAGNKCLDACVQLIQEIQGSKVFGVPTNKLIKCALKLQAQGS